MEAKWLICACGIQKFWKQINGNTLNFKQIGCLQNSLQMTEVNQTQHCGHIRETTSEVIRPPNINMLLVLCAGKRARPCRNWFQFSSLMAEKKNNCSKKPFPSSLEPLFQSESKCEVFEMKMSFHLIWKAELITITKLSHLDSL